MLGTMVPLTVSWGTLEDMCGRYASFRSDADLVSAFSVAEVVTPDRPPSWNVAPQQDVRVILDRAPRDKPAAKVRQLRTARWGLVPAWATDPAIGNRLINARSETVREKPSFRNAFRRRRCLIPASGFYEWRRNERGKQPFYVRMRDGRVFAFAGVWDRWESPEGGVIESCAILTTGANAVLAPIHDRMPVILRPEREAEWVSKEVLSADTLSEMFEPLPAASMDAYPVSDMVNDSHLDHPDMVVPQRMQQATLF